MQARVWSGRQLHPSALAVLAGIADVMVTSVGELNDWHVEATTTDAIVMRGTTQITGAVLDAIGPRLRVVARTGIGVDNIDLTAATQRGILVTNTPDGPTESTAEHAIALLLNLCKRVMTGDRMLRSGRPFPSVTELPLGLETDGAVLGLVGLGRIGSRVAIIANVLGMRVLAYDPFIQAERAAALHVELVDTLEELLPRAQVVSLHCPALPQTHHIINAERLQLMQKGSYLINVARGALIDSAALLQSLQSGHLAGAGLDVFDPEPPAADDPLLTLPNVICTPHIGSYTAASVERMQVMACQEIARVLQGERPLYLVNDVVWERRRRL